MHFLLDFTFILSSIYYFVKFLKINGLGEKSLMVIHSPLKVQKTKRLKFYHIFLIASERKY